MAVLKTTPSKLPARLGKAPLVDAIFEVRFEPAKEGTGQLLPGLFFAKLGTRYARSEATPLASIPAQMREQDRSLRYQFQYRLLGDSAAISVGDRSAGVSASPPYQGWEFFRPRIEEFLTVLRESGLVKRLERFSLKFVNVVDVPADPQLSLLNLDLRLGGITAPDDGFHLRTELRDAHLIRIVDIQPKTTAKLPSGETRSGLLLSVDCIKASSSGSMDELTPEAIEQVHQDLKQIFFGLITPTTLSALDPTN